MASTYTPVPNTLRLRSKRGASHADPPLLEDLWAANCEPIAREAQPTSMVANTYVPIPDSDDRASRTPSPPTSDGWEVLAQPLQDNARDPSGECSQCKKSVDDLKAHENECPEALMQCPSRPSCEAFVLRKNLDRHKDTCPFALVRCGLASCDARIFRCQLASHFTSEHAPGGNSNDDEGTGNAHDDAAETQPLLAPPPAPKQQQAPPAHSSPCEMRGAAVDEHDEPLHRAPVLPRVERVPCPISPECGQILLPDLVDMHVAECPHKLVRCPNGCMDKTLRVERKALAAHRAVCPRERIACVNSQCDAKVLREEMQQHLAKDCEHSLVVCDFAQMGCGAAVPRRDMAQHFERCQHQHMVCMHKALARSMHEIVSLRKDTNLLRNEVVRLRKASVLRTAVNTASSALHAAGETVADAVVAAARVDTAPVLDKVRTAAGWTIDVLRHNFFFFAQALLLAVVVLSLDHVLPVVHPLVVAWPFLHLMIMDSLPRDAQPRWWLALALYMLAVPGATTCCLVAAPLVFMHSEIIVPRPLWRVVAAMLGVHAALGLSILYTPLPVLPLVLRVCTAMLVLDRGMRDTTAVLPDHMPNIMMPVGLIVMLLEFLVFVPATFLPRETEPFLLLCVLRAVTYINEDLQRCERVRGYVNEVADHMVCAASRHGELLGALLAMMLHFSFSIMSFTTATALILAALVARHDLWGGWSSRKNVGVGLLLLTSWATLPASGLVVLVMWADAVYWKSGLNDGLRKRISVGWFVATLGLAVFDTLVHTLSTM